MGGTMFATAALAAPAVLHTVVGDNPRFLHDQPVSDVHVDGDELLVLSGCSVTRWTRSGERQSTAALEGCSEGLNHGFFSHDGQWVANAGLMVGDSGVWRVTGGARVLAADGVQWGTLCGGAWWDLPADGGLRRADLATGAVTHPLGDGRAGTTCIDDQWLLTSTGHHLSLDGTSRELTRSPSVKGTTGDGRALLWGDDQVHLLGPDGPGEVVLWLDDPPEFVAPSAAGGFVVGGTSDDAWRFDATGRPAAGPFRVDDQGLSGRNGEGGAFRWAGEDWAWTGRRVFPMVAGVGPVDDSGERFFFGGEGLWLCDGLVCERHDLVDRAAPVRTVTLPTGLGSEDGVSPSGRFVAQSGVDLLVRTDLETGEIGELQLADQWPDDVVVDDGGHVRYLVADDSDDDGRYRHDVFIVEGTAPRAVAGWTSRELAELGLRVDGLDVRRIRWPAASRELEDADAWSELAGGLVAASVRYGEALVVFGPDGATRASVPGPVEGFGPWGDGLWVGRGQRVTFLGPDGQPRSHLEVPWPLGDEVVDGVGSGDGRWFGARRPDGALAVWQTGPAIPAAPTTPAAPWPPVAPRLVVGQQLGAPELPAPSRLDVDWDSADNDVVFTVALEAWFRAPDDELRRELEGVIAANPPSDDAAYLSRQRFLDALPAVRPGDTRPTAPGLQALPRPSPRETRNRYGVLELPPRAPGPLFGVAACPDTFPATPPTPNPSGPLPAREGERLVTLLVAVSADGTPTWVATEPDDGVGATGACWRHAASGTWSPAQDASGAPVAACVRHRCRFGSERN